MNCGSRCVCVCVCMCVCVCYHGDIRLEDLFDELVLGGVNQLNDVTVQSVSVLLQEACRTHTHTHTQKETH